VVGTNNRKPEGMFYPGWVVLSALSIPIAWNIAWAIMSQIVKVVGDTIKLRGQTHITEDFLGFYVLLPVLGLVTGSLQYLLLRRYLPRMGWWIAATFLGWLLVTVTLGFFAFFALFSTTPPSPALGFVFASVFIGSSTALFQWLLLRQRVHRAALWILTSALGWGMALLLTDGAISSQQEVLSVVLVPPIAGSIGWWLLLDKLPQRESNGGNTPRNAAQEPSVPRGAD
jgi:hypothetical protein